MKGKGERPEYLDAAKTLWLASDERQAQRNLLPFGWLLVEPYRDAGELAPWPARGERSGRRAMALRHPMPGRRRCARARRRSSARRSERQREAEEVAARRGGARRAARQPERRGAQDRAPARRCSPATARPTARRPGASWPGNLVALLKEAEESWQGPDCAVLADLALEIYGFIGWPSRRRRSSGRSRSRRFGPRRHESPPYPDELHGALPCAGANSSAPDAVFNTERCLRPGELDRLFAPRADSSTLSIPHPVRPSARSEGMSEQGIPRGQRHARRQRKAFFVRGPGAPGHL